MRRCCDLSGLEHIEVDGRKVGIFGLREAIAEVVSLGLSDEERIAEELLSRIAARNYISPQARDAYKKALLREYRKAVRKDG
ncbi:hypothetical protein H5T52_07070 [Candidatus Bipolaricaulota bacterium]|nr:hypothetical protein [Candidatus Bipolaricaulota bacterium]